MIFVMLHLCLEDRRDCFPRAGQIIHRLYTGYLMLLTTYISKYFGCRKGEKTFNEDFLGKECTYMYVKNQVQSGCTEKIGHITTLQ
jgi:hypothetical protein